MNNEFFSRERSAGYDPDKLAGMRVLVIGAGALGQNVLQTIAMALPGQIRLIDFDTWDEHNVTRSPLYSNAEVRRQHANLKAPCVAHELAERTAWSELPTIEYAVGRVQAYGDKPFEEATVVLCCVDDPATRSDIAEVCLRHNAPMIEGGVEGAAGSFAVYHGRYEACWQCGVAKPERSRVPIGSCRMNAEEQARQGHIAMTQTLVSIVGAYMAEAAIQLAHGNAALVGKRVYVDDIRHPGVAIVAERPNRDCPCNHAAERPSLVLQSGSTDPVGYVLEELAQHFDEPAIVLRAPFIGRDICAGPLHDPNASCGRVVNVGLPDWAISRHPRCRACGGEFEAASHGNAALWHEVGARDHELMDRSAASLGIAAGEWLTVTEGATQLHTVGLSDECEGFVRVK